MSPPPSQEMPKKERGILAFFVSHPTAANLLMAMALVGGLYVLTKVNKQFFPNIEIPTVIVSVPWLGASAEDVDKSIASIVVPAVRSVDGVVEVRSTSREGSATVFIEFSEGTDLSEAAANVETEVSALTTLPEDSEDPSVFRVIVYDPVVSLILSGPFSEHTLRVFARQLRNGLLNKGVERVQLEGMRREEVWVEVPQKSLLAYDLTLDDVSRAVSSAQQNIPLGTLEAGATGKQIRAQGVAEEDERFGVFAKALGEVEIKSLASGEKLYLGDMARIVETFHEDDANLVKGGFSAIRLKVERTANADVIASADLVNEFLEEVRPTLPQGMNLEAVDVRADLVRARISLLLKNAMTGLILVLGLLFLFLKPRVALWVSVGIPVAISMTFIGMQLTGQSINMISLFAVLMMVGVIVDDAIVVGEHAVSLSDKGASPQQAALGGARRMLGPVLASTLTTVAAFLPMLLIQDVLGQIMAAMGFVIILSIVASFLECFVILPAHMRHALTHTKPSKVDFFLDGVSNGFNKFRDTTFRPLSVWCYENRYISLSGALGLVIISLGLVVGGRVPFTFFPATEAESMTASLEFIPGTSREVVVKSINILEETLEEIVEELVGNSGEQPIKAVLGTIGSGGSHFGNLWVELSPSVERKLVRTSDLAAKWRQRAPQLPGLEKFQINLPRAGPPGKDIDIRLKNAPPHVLKQASLELQDYLKGFGGILSLSDDLPYNKSEIVIELSPRGKALGLTTQILSRQVRAAITGSVARRFFRGEEEVSVRVKIPNEDERRTLENIYIKTPQGQKVLLSEVANLTQRIGFAQIRRLNNERSISISADVDSDVILASQVYENLNKEFIPQLLAKTGVEYSVGGRAEEQSKAFSDVGTGGMVALVIMYLILAWVFGNYSYPLVVMLTVPFGVVGVIFGHLLGGFYLSILSVIAMLGLSGMLINGSIVLVKEVQHLVDEEALGFKEAVVEGTCRRLRPMILSTFTTILGFLPLLAEQDLQAQFLKPMAVSFAGGLFVSMFLVLLVIPAFLGVWDDIHALKIRLKGYLFPKGTR